MLRRKPGIIAVDGPASSGKSTTARLLARRLGYVYLDTGAMYRAITLKALRAEVDLEDERALQELARNSSLQMTFKNQQPRIFLDGEEVTAQIRAPEVSAAVSKVSTHARVRKAMVALQKEIAKEGGIVAEGRDMGTVVFPGAELKVFLTCDLEERAKRRRLELKSQGVECSLEKIRESLSKRDKIDSTREDSPLRQAEDAVVIDTTDLTIEEQVEEVLRHLKNHREVP